VPRFCAEDLRCSRMTRERFNSQPNLFDMMHVLSLPDCYFTAISMV
jgi:hypothetical protein